MEYRVDTKSSKANVVVEDALDASTSRFNGESLYSVGVRC